MMEFSEKFKEMMENESDNEEIPDNFICCICRDLLYKPVVLACGHISCFWCVSKSMSGLHQSRCPICRNEYYHFPSICQTLHLFLPKMYPIAYKKRESQTLEEEKAMGFFSPQFESPAYELQSEENIIFLGDASQHCISESNPPSSTYSIKKEDSLVRSNSQKLTKDDRTVSISSVEDKNLHSKYKDGNCEPVSVNDVLCGLCNGMLLQPIVLNCGHVFCASCVIVQTNGTLKCQVCQCPHPGKIPEVCLEFDHFLEEQFPEEYALRKVNLQTKQVHFQCESPSKCSPEGRKEKLHTSSSSGENPLPWTPGSNIHFGFGCDSCGVFSLYSA